MGTIADRIALVRDALARGIVSLGQMARAESGDATKALFGDGSFKAPGGGITGTITADAILKATGPTTVGNSSLSEPTTGNVISAGTLGLGGGTHTDANDPFGFGYAAEDILVATQTVTVLGAKAQTNAVLAETVINLTADADIGAQVIGVNIGVTVANTNTHDIPNIVNGMSSVIVHNGTGLLHYGAGFFGGIFNESTAHFNLAYGSQSIVENDGDGTIDKAYGCYAAGAQNFGSGTLTNSYSFFAEALFNSGTIGNNFGLWIADQNPANGGGTTANSYALWYDGRGVYRIKEDPTLGSVPALYNNLFTKYTPGAVDFERIVQQWNANIAEIGLEAGGTGTLRLLRLLGSAVAIPSAAPANAAATGVAGTVTWDGDFVYVCTAANTWKRAAIATW